MVREEFRLAWDEAKRPGAVELIGAVVSAFVAWLADQPRSLHVWQAASVGVATGLSLWLLRFIGHLWLAPRRIAADDRKTFDSAYENLVSENKALRKATTLPSEVERLRSDNHRLLAMLESLTRVLEQQGVTAESKVDQIRNVVVTAETGHVAITGYPPEVIVRRPDGTIVHDAESQS